MRSITLSIFVLWLCGQMIIAQADTFPLADGTTVTADQAYLTESIKVPGAKTVAEFGAGAMPNFGLILKDSQIADLVAFIMTVK